MNLLSFDALLRYVSVIIIIVCGSLWLFSDAAGIPDDFEEQITPEFDLNRICSFSPQAAKKSWRFIIIHQSRSKEYNSFEEYRAAYMQKGYPEMPFHFVIRKDGRVEKTLYWMQQQSCLQVKSPENPQLERTYNPSSIGICLMGKFDASDPKVSGSQLAGLKALVKHLQENFGIKKPNIHKRSAFGGEPGRGAGIPDVFR